MRKRSWVRFLLSFILLAGLSGPVASPQPVFGSGPVTVCASVGPIALPPASVTVCLNGDDCKTIGAACSVSVEVCVTADATVGIPTITTKSCPPPSIGGAVITITTGGTSATVSGTVSGTLCDGSSFSKSIGPITVPGLSSVTLTVCADAS